MPSSHSLTLRLRNSIPRQDFERNLHWILRLARIKVRTKLRAMHAVHRIAARFARDAYRSAEHAEFTRS
jgi:hypothetical protein